MSKVKGSPTVELAAILSDVLAASTLGYDDKVKAIGIARASVRSPYVQAARTTPLLKPKEQKKKESK